MHIDIDVIGLTISNEKHIVPRIERAVFERHPTEHDTVRSRGGVALDGREIVTSADIETRRHALFDPILEGPAGVRYGRIIIIIIIIISMIFQPGLL